MKKLPFLAQNDGPLSNSVEFGLHRVAPSGRCSLGRAPLLPAPSRLPCYSRGKLGHYSRECPQKAPATATPAPAPSTPAAKAMTVSRGRLNHISADGVEEDPSVLMGTLRINGYPASVLFDSGASHSFISIAVAHSHPGTGISAPPGFSGQDGRSLRPGDWRQN